MFASPGDKYHRSLVVIGFSFHKSTALSVAFFPSSSVWREKIEREGNAKDETRAHIQTDSSVSVNKS